MSGPQLSSPRQVVPILVRSEQGPELASRRPVFVEQGQKAAINPKCCLDLVDEDGENTLLITVLHG